MSPGRAGLPLPGDVIGGRYLVEDRLGEGGMAVVYRARHTGTDRACALKFILPELAEEPKQREQFLREARVAGRIGAHPHIVDVFDTGLDEQRGAPFIAMELLQGETLARFLKRTGPVPWELARTMLEQIADALDAAHQAGVVHRDLKPGNIFVTIGRKGEQILKVLDFGIAKFTEGLGGETSTQVGTPWYSAPEQLGASMRRLAADRGINVAATISPATDVWAVALIAYEFLTGLAPRHYWGSQTLVDQLVKLSLETRVPPTARSGERARYLPPGFDEWFLCCTQHDAAHRYQGVGQAVAALGLLLRSAPAVAWAPAPAVSDPGSGFVGPATPSHSGHSGPLGVLTPHGVALPASGAGPLTPGPGLGAPASLAASGALGASGPMADTAGSWQHDAGIAGRGRSKVWVGVAAACGVLGLGAAAAFLLMAPVGPTPAGQGATSAPEPTAPAVAEAAPASAAAGEPSSAAPGAASAADAPAATSSSGPSAASSAGSTPTRTARPAPKPATAATTTKGSDGSFDDLFGKR